MSLFEREKPALTEFDENRFMTRKELIELKRKERAVDAASNDYEKNNLKDRVHTPNSPLVKL